MGAVRCYRSSKWLVNVRRRYKHVSGWTEFLFLFQGMYVRMDVLLGMYSTRYFIYVHGKDVITTPWVAPNFYATLWPEHKACEIIHTLCPFMFCYNYDWEKETEP